MSNLKFGGVLTILLASMFIAACGGVSGAPQVIVPTAPAISVDITSDTCPGIEIAPGTQVIWTNKDKVDHIIRVQHATGNDILIDLGTLKPGDAAAFTFIETGSYPYWCSPDQKSEGMVTVKP